MLIFQYPRIAIRLLFAIVAFFLGLWTFRIHEFQLALEIGHQELSYLLLALPIAMTICISQAPRLGRMFGMVNLIRLGIGGVISVVFAISFFPNFITAFMLLAVLGACAAFFEIGLNTVVDKLERDGKKLMASCHGFWSIGFAIGGLVSSLLASAEVSFLVQQLLVTPISFFALILFTSSLPQPQPAKNEQHGHALPSLAILPICLLPFTGLFIEGAIADWNSPYLIGERGWEKFAAGWATFVFMGSMAIARLFGDALRDRFPVLFLFKISTLLSLIGVTLYAFSDHLLTVSFGLFCAGFGTGNVYPYALVLGAEGKDESEASYIFGSIALVSYNAFVLAPVFIGFIGSQLSLSLAFAAIVPLFALTFLWIGLAQRASKA